MKTYSNTSSTGKFASSNAISTLILALALIGSTCAFAQAPAHNHELAVSPTKTTEPVKKAKKVPGKLAQLVHLKKNKKTKVVDSRMNSADEPGTIATSVSDVKLKKIPLSKDKPEEVSVAQ